VGLNGQQKVLVLRQRRRRRNRAKGGVGRIALRLAMGLVAVVLLSNLFAILIGIGTAVGVYGNYAKDLPDPNEIVTAQEKFPWSRSPRISATPPSPWRTRLSTATWALIHWVSPGPLSRICREARSRVEALSPYS
jgi:hypothetical protein